MAKSLFRRISRTEMIFKRLQHDDPKTIYAGLLTVAKNKEFSHGWVCHKFKTIFGKWPRPKGKVELGQPSSDLLCWLESQRRNYGARMARKDSKTQAEIAAQSAAALGRLEGTLAEIEANPLGRHYDLGDYGAALDTVCRLERKMMQNIENRDRFVEAER